RDDRAIDETYCPRARYRGQKSDHNGGEKRQPGIEGRANGKRREHGGEAHDPADGKIDAGADDDEGLAEAEEQDRRDRQQNVLRVADGEEIHRATVVDRYGDHEEDDHQAEERPSPEATER